MAGALHLHRCRQCGDRFPCHGESILIGNPDGAPTSACLAFDVRGLDRCNACRVVPVEAREDASEAAR
jgi:hypothetical protein